ncbi:MAG: UvrD-helicase domain-containing protein [Bacilli bacterium]|nr:UvrD-helicase domain-containing protein [Bacilli bacterium]
MPNWTKEQSDAINFDNSNIIVSAGAGSGKTAVLSERVIRKLKQGVHINELLILTFTNAAAKEMKDRIRKKIKDNNLNDELLLLDSSYITTFDSYSLSVLKKYHYLLNISKNIKIVDSDLIKYQKEKILDEIFEEYYKNNDAKFLKLISDFCIKNDNEIREYILNLSSKLDLIIDLDNYLDSYIDNYYNNEYIDEILKKLDEIVKLKIDNINNLLVNLSYYVDDKYYQKITEELSKIIKCDNYDDVKLNISNKLPILKTESEEAKSFKSEIKKELDFLKDLTKYSKEEIKNNIISTKEYVEIIIDIIKRLNERMTSFKTKNELYEFNDVAKLSIKLLKEHEEVRNEIKDSLNEIMVDEYQDTNDIQEEFISLISNNNVYMVGDIKQSIYRFRNANPNIFKNKYENYSKRINGIKIDLNKNFRSREETLNNINKLFNLLMDSYIGGANYFDSHQMIFGNATYNIEGKTDQNNNFEIYNYDYDKESGFTKEEYEIFLIASDIKNKVNNKYKVFDKDTKVIRDASYSDFVILLDKSKNFTLYKKIFEYNNIPLSILKDEKINDEILLTIIKNLLVCLVKINKKELDNDFKHSFTSVLRSFIFEYDDERIFDLYLNNNFYENEVYKELKEINISSKTVKEIINILVDRFNIIESLSKIGNINTNMTIIEYLLNYVDTKESIGYDIEEFTNYLIDIIDMKYEIKVSNNISDSNSVKIMTIHKSKGLEYNICYYAGLYEKFNINEIKDRFIYDKKYGIITPYYKDGIGETIYKHLINLDYMKEEISERIRLFYVALTRAKEKMIILADLNGEKYGNKDENGVLDINTRLSYRSFLDMIISVKKELQSYVTKIDKIDMNKEYELIKNMDYKKSIPIIDNKLVVKEIKTDKELKEQKKYSKTISKLLTKEEIDKLKYGRDVHYLFEIEDFDNPKNNLVKKFLEKYKYKKPINTYKEFEFIFEDKNELFHGIIDLMLEYENYIDIIDYKLKNIDDEEYLKQLEGYKNYIYNKTKKEVNIYLYSILDNDLKKII